jgi:hypothetical protein
MPNKILTKADLAQFYGSDTIYRHTLNRRMLYTVGVKYVAETGGAHWLIDDIAIYNMTNGFVVEEEFQVWKLTVTGTEADLVCEDGDYNVVFTKHIEFTDFPLDSIEIWVENNTMMLPSER